MSKDEFRKASKAVWDNMARGWEDKREYMWETSKPVAEWLVESLEPQPGQTILELAAGLGDTGFVAANFVGPDGRVISTDFSPAMVEAARHRAEELGVSHAEFRVIDAENMDLDDDSVGGVLCRWGYMLMGDPGAALKETRRVLRPGGRLSFSVFAGPEQNPWAALPAKALIDGGFMQAPPPGSPGILALADKDRLTQLLNEAGFSNHVIEEVTITWRYSDFDDYWRFLTEVAGAIAALLASLSPAEKNAAREAIRSAVSQFETESGLAFPGVTINTVTQ